MYNIYWNKERHKILLFRGMTREIREGISIEIKLLIIVGERRDFLAQGKKNKRNL